MTINAKQVTAILDHVLVEDMEFSERITKHGIVILNDNGKSYGIRPRWGKVYAVGPDQTDVAAGQWVMVEHGRWTRGFEITKGGADMVLRRVDVNDIILVSDSRPDDQTLSTIE